MLLATGLPRWSAQHYAEAAAAGHTLLVVHAPFGTGGHAEDLLAEGEPVALGTEPFRRHLLPSNLAAPLSRSLGLPTLARRGRTTSEALGLPCLVQSGRTTSEALGVPAVTRSRPFAIGEPRMPDEPAPFSRLLHLPILTRRGRTLGQALGLPELLRDDRFAFGSPQLSDAPAPFSRLLHLPVLIRDRIAGRAQPRLERREIRRGDTSPSTSTTPSAIDLRAADLAPAPRDGAGHRRSDDTARIG